MIYIIQIKKKKGRCSFSKPILNFMLRKTQNVLDIIFYYYVKIAHNRNLVVML